MLNIISKEEKKSNLSFGFSTYIRMKCDRDQVLQQVTLNISEIHATTLINPFFFW